MMTPKIPKNGEANILPYFSSSPTESPMRRIVVMKKLDTLYFKGILKYFEYSSSIRFKVFPQKNLHVE